MNQKYISISRGFFLSFLFIAIFSFFKKDIIFDGMAQVATVAVLPFAIVNIIYSKYESVFGKCENKIEILNEQVGRIDHIINAQERYLNWIEDFKEDMTINDDGTTRAEFYNKQKKILEDYSTTYEKLNLERIFYTNIKSNILKNKLLSWNYSIFFAILIVGLLLSSILAPCLSVIPLPTLSFLALTISMFDILFREHFAEKKLHNFFKLEQKKEEEKEETYNEKEQEKEIIKQENPTHE
ncbi:MAG: hypothetical protein FWG91_08620 [Lachnospiraceae bacterium]|nr:hypothetical protein [Lachnospiraceae bacterium]